MEYWIQLTQETEINCMFGIVGNKCDLYMEEQVTEEEARIFAKSKGYKFKLVSAKSNPNTLNEFLEELVQDYNELNNINNPNAKIIYLDKYYYDYEEERLVNCCGETRKRKYKYKCKYEKYTPKFEKIKHFFWRPYKPKFKLRLKSKERAYI